MSPPPPEGENYDHIIAASEVGYISSQKKRSNSDATEYPRRRATIAVGAHALSLCSIQFQIRSAKPHSAKYVDYAKQDVTELGQNANSAQTSTPNASIVNQESNSTQETN